MPTLNRLIDLPPANSRSMRAYMQAILEVTGLMAGQEFPMKLFMENYRAHLEPKANFPHATMQKTSADLYRLTSEGVQFFSSRLTQAPVITGQQVSRAEVIEMIRAIVSAEAQNGWEAFSIQLPENA